jgi:glycosyltransferase involved in cell wall biosynthesis/predicted Zn-dependent protease
VVSDGDDSLQARDLDGVEFFRLPNPHLDYGNVARAIGSVSAMARGFDAIAYLDADNWYEPEHLQRMAELHRRTTAAVCTAARNLRNLEGDLLGRCPEADGVEFADTSCLFLTPAAFGMVSAWYRMPPALGVIGDRVVWKALKDAGLSLAHSPEPTVNFRSHYVAHYTHFGKTPPPGTKHVQFELSPTGEYLTAHAVVLEEPSCSSSPGRQRVSLCMIVKNEEAHLVDCLGPVASLFGEIIVVDTGSTDGTNACARRMGAKVYDFAWVDSFAAARNESLRHATMEWIFWLDADERLDEANLDKLRRLFATLPDGNNAYLMRQWSAPDQLTGASIVVDQTRLFRNLPAARWRGRVHEQIFMALQAQGAQAVETDIVIRHLGYQAPDLRRRKHERNARLLHMDLQDDPRDAFACFNLANVHMDGGRVEEAVHLLQRCLECAPVRSSYLPKAHFLLAGGCHLLGRTDEALHYCYAGKKDFPDDVGLWFYEGILLMARGDLAGAQHAFETILKLPSQGHYTGVDAKLPGCRTRHNLAYIYRRLGRAKDAEQQWQQAVFEAPEFEPPWLALVELYLEQGRHLEAEALPGRLEGKAYRDAIWPALEARLTLADGDVAGARRILEKALLRNPKAVWLRILLADILQRVVADDQAAEQHLRTVLALCPNEQQSRQKLAQLISKRGRCGGRQGGR